MEFLPTQPLAQPPKVVSTKNPHTRFFHSFRHPLFIKHHHPITSIHFSPSKPHRFAVTTSTRVLIYAPKTGKVVKNITRFKDTARSGEIRKDGKLVIAGGDDGLVQVFDINSRAILRTMKEHNQPVHVTHFSPHGPQVLSASDDKSVRLWDLASESCLNNFAGHTDYVRSAAFLPNDPNLILSGAYDSTIKLWDVRTGQAELSMRHGGAPVETVLPFATGGVAVSLGGPILRVWDLTMGGRCVAAMSNHQKTVTCATFDGEQRRLLTGGLDQMVKVYDVENWNVVHTMRYSAPVLSLAMSPDDTHIAAGLTDGTFSLRRRDPKPSETSAAEQMKSAVAGGAYEYFADMEQVFNTGHVKSKTTPSVIKGPEDEFRAETKRRQRLKEFDRFLRLFKYSAALDASLKKTLPALTTFAVLQELVHRDGLRIALQGRDDVTLEPLLAFLLRHITDPRFGEMASEIAGVVIDMYTPILGQAPLIDPIVAKLQKKIEAELKFQQELIKLGGAMEMTLAQAALGKLEI